MNFIEIVKSVENEIWTQAMFRSGDVGQFRIGGKWLRRGPVIQSPAHLQALLIEIIPKDERTKMSSDRIKFNLTTGSETISVAAYVHGDSWIVQLSKKSSVKQFEDFNLPARVLSGLSEKGGICWLSGSVHSGKDALVDWLLNDCEDRNQIVAWIGEDCDRRNVLQFSNAQFNAGNWPQGTVDILVLEDPSVQTLKTALRMAGRGTSLLVLKIHKNLVQSLEDLKFDLEDSDWLRFSQHISWGVSVEKIETGVEVSWLNEVFFGTAQIKNSLKGADWEKVLELMKTGGEFGGPGGMRSINQSLVQLILKRKVPLKMGFEMSPKPDELDGMLKQIGI